MSYNRKVNYYLSTEKNEKIKSLYLDGLSAQEIKDNLGLKVSIRQLQRWLKDWGIIRTKADSFRNAVKRGRVKYRTNPNKIKRNTLRKKLRFQILIRDNFACVLCGNTAKESRIEVDHIDNNKNNNIESNLQTLCEDCNKGKGYSS